MKIHALIEILPFTFSSARVRKDFTDMYPVLSLIRKGSTYVFLFAATLSKALQVYFFLMQYAGIFISYMQPATDIYRILSSSCWCPEKIHTYVKIPKPGLLRRSKIR